VAPASEHRFEQSLLERAVALLSADAIYACELIPKVKEVRFPRAPGTQVFRVVARID